MLASLFNCDSHVVNSQHHKEKAFVRNQFIPCDDFLVKNQQKFDEWMEISMIGFSTNIETII